MKLEMRNEAKSKINDKIKISCTKNKPKKKVFLSLQENQDQIMRILKKY